MSTYSDTRSRARTDDLHEFSVLQGGLFSLLEDAQRCYSVEKAVAAKDRCAKLVNDLRAPRWNENNIQRQQAARLVAIARNWKILCRSVAKGLEQ